MMSYPIGHLWARRFLTFARSLIVVIFTVKKDKDQELVRFRKMVPGLRNYYVERIFHMKASWIHMLKKVSAENT